MDYIKAQYEGKMIDQDRLMVPLQRELEQLRTRTYGEGKFAETFRTMELEKNEMKVEIETLKTKNDVLIDDFTVSQLLNTLYEVYRVNF